MRLVVEDPLEKGLWEVNWFWLPAFFGVDNHFMHAVHKHIQENFLPIRVPEDEREAFLDQVDLAVIDFACQRLPHAKGLREYLLSVLKVEWE